MTKLRWNVFADGPVGNEVLNLLALKNPASVACIITLFDRSTELNRTFTRAKCMTWAELQETSAIDTIRGVAEIVLLAWWPFLLKRNLLDLGQKAMLNMHPSLLPYGRGKDPNFWSLAEGEPAGVTIHHVDDGIDCGDIAFQREIFTSWTDTGQTLYRRSQKALISLFEEAYARMVNLDIPRIKQDLTTGSFHRRSELDPASMLDLNKSYGARQLLNVLRARTFEGHPACCFYDKGEAYEVTVNIRRKK